MSNPQTRTEKKVLQRLGMSQLQCDLRTLFRAEPPARALLSGLAHIGEYLGGDYLVVHARIGSTFLSEEFQQDFEPSDSIRDVINGAMGDVMEEGQARCIRLRNESGGDGPTVIAAVLRDEDNEPAGGAAILLRECSRERAVETFSAFEGILGFVSVLVASPGVPAAAEPSAAAQPGLAIDADDPVQLAFYIAGGMANRHGLDQVAVGTVSGKNVRIAAVSGMDEVRTSNPGLKRIRDAMEEALDEGEPILLGNEDDLDAHPHRDFPLHRQWRSHVAGDCVATVPIKNGDQVVGVVGLRDRAGGGLRRESLAAFEAELAPYGRVLPLAMRAQRGLVRHAWDSVKAACKSIAGGTFWRAAAAVAIVCALAGWLAFGTMPYSVVVNGRIAIAERQHVSCPMDGVLRRVHVRVGDRVEPGQLLAELDTKMDELEASELAARIAAKQIESDRALAESAVVDRRVLQSQLRALRAEAATIEERIARGQIRAAVAGVVVAGDPRDRIGYPLLAGFDLFELASTDRVRVVLSIPERSIGLASAVQAVDFVPAALPDEAIDLRALRFPPSAAATDEGMMFEAYTELALAEAGPRLIPGMEGVARLEVGHRNAWWVLTHRITDWLRMGFWI